MGSWFSNLHIRRAENIEPSAVDSALTEMMTAANYLPAENAAEADAAVAILGTNSEWISVYSDFFEFGEPKQFQDIARPISERLHTDVLGIACFDSDFMFMNLINPEQKLDAFARIGGGYGVKRRSNFSAWKNKVTDLDAFKRCAAENEYAFAEEFLMDTAQYTGLNEELAISSYDTLGELELPVQKRYLYFKLPDTVERVPPKLILHSAGSSCTCTDGKWTWVGVANVGGASRGLSVFFIGSYVENDEISFSDLYLETGHEGTRTPFELKKVRLIDGRLAYYYNAPEYKIPKAVKDGLSWMKKFDEESKREIKVVFTLHGDERKMLDIILVVSPDKNPEGQYACGLGRLWLKKEIHRGIQ